MTILIVRMIYLDDLRNATGAQLFGETAAREFSAFCHESADIEPGQLYVALKLGVQDGHRFIEQAIAKGAAGILCQEPPTTAVTGVTVVLVGDTTAALGQWAAYVLRQYGTLVIAVTGAVGKSSTAAAIAAVLSSHYSVYYRRNVVGGRAGLAMCLGGIEANYQITVVELSPARQGEMSDLISITQPGIGVITGLAPRAATEARLEQSVKEAQQLLDALPETGSAIINLDDRQSRRLIDQARIPVIRYTTSHDITTNAELAALNVQYSIDKVSFDLNQDGARLRECTIPSLGEPGLITALAALCVGLLFEIPLPRALRTLQEIKPLPGHLTFLSGINQTALIDDTSHATLTSTLAALDLMRSIGQGRRILVLGDLEALPNEIEKIHQEVGQQAASFVDLLITYGQHAAGAAQASFRAGLPHERGISLYRHIDIIRALHQQAQPGDLILVTGGRASQMMRIVEGLIENPLDKARLTPLQTVSSTIATTTSSWSEVNLDAVVNNLEIVRQRVSPAVKIMAVVKGNAYGHGLLPIAATALQNGAAMLGASTVAEAVDLRYAGITEPILVLGYITPPAIHLAVQNQITLTLVNRDQIRLVAQAARESRQTARVHLRVDTGLGDYGIRPQDVAACVRDIMRVESLLIDGIYTEFAAADSLFESAATHQQLKRFQGIVDSLRATGLTIPHIHAANSAAVLTLLSSSFTMVRIGMLMYGLHPSVDVSCPPGCLQALTWKTTVAQVKQLVAGTPIGYGSTYRAEHDLQIAILPVGYADGFRGGPHNWGEVLIRGKRVRLLGRVSMDRCVVNVTPYPDVQEGDEVVLIGKQGSDKITVEEVARRLDCTSYEVVTSISPSIPRIT